MRAPDDQGEAALLAVVGAGVARAAAEAGEAVAAKAATKFAAACSSAAKGAEADASKDAKNLLLAPFVADAPEEAPLPPPPPKAGPKIIAPKAAFDGTESEPGTAKAEAPPAEAADGSAGAGIDPNSASPFMPSMDLATLQNAAAMWQMAMAASGAAGNSLLSLRACCMCRLTDARVAALVAERR